MQEREKANAPELMRKRETMTMENDINEDKSRNAE
jgi:hypothetical protein